MIVKVEADGKRTDIVLLSETEAEYCQLKYVTMVELFDRGVKHETKENTDTFGLSVPPGHRKFAIKFSAV